jgi:formate/nitrite transporter FocA (FNT family)
MEAKTYTPRETTELVSRAGVAKAHMRVDKVFLSSVNAGMILSFACASHLSIQSSEWFQDNAAGLIRALGALVFPYGKFFDLAAPFNANDGRPHHYHSHWIGSLHW